MSEIAPLPNSAKPDPRTLVAAEGIKNQIGIAKALKMV